MSGDINLLYTKLARRIITSGCQLSKPRFFLNLINVKYHENIFNWAVKVVLDRLGQGNILCRLMKNETDKDRNPACQNCSTGLTAYLLPLELLKNDKKKLLNIFPNRGIFASPWFPDFHLYPKMIF